jgi:hypothetical protein
MRVLDLFSGLGGFSQAFKDRGHDVTTVDFLEKFNPDICANIINLTPKELMGPWHVIVASPPCNGFSVASVYHHWDNSLGVPLPKSGTAIKGIQLVAHTLHLILNLHPIFWYLENPRGMLRRILGPPQQETFFASWGDFVKKPTDLWGVHAPMKWFKPGWYDPTPRGAKNSGTQGAKRNPAKRALIPYGLSLAICKACEKALERLL